MTDQNKGVETLQTDVDTIAADLAEAKKLTDETLKKSKAEAAVIKAEVIVGKVKTAKEEANKKLEALAGKTDATSKAEIVKLEAEIKKYETMLTALDSSKTELTTLKAGVVVPENISSNEAIDNSVDLATIKTNIATITTLATTLQSEIDAYTLAKAKMTAAEITIKEKDIVDKKLVIETKRKETQALIDKIRAARKALKIKDMAEGLPKTALEKLQTADETVLTADQTALDKIETPGRTFFEKVGDVVGKGRNKVKDGANKTREWAKENPKTAIAATAGIGLLIRGISRLFKKKDKSEKKDGDEKKEKKGFRDKWYGKALKWGLIGTGVGFLAKRLLSGKRPRSKTEGTGADAGDVLRSTENAAESFEELMKDKPKEAEKLNTYGTKVNDVYDEVYKFNDGTVPDGVEEAKLGGEGCKEKYAGAIPHILDNTFSTIDKMESQRGLFVLCTYGDIAEIKKAFSKLIAEKAGNVVSGVLGFFGISGLVDASNVEAKVDEFIGGKNTIDEMHMVFRKILKVMSYTNYLENAYLAKDIETETKAGKILYKKEDDKYTAITFPTDAEEIKELITDMQYNPSDYKIGEVEISTLRNNFREQSLSTAFATYDMTTKEILAYNYDIAEDIETINEDRDETLKDLAEDKNGTLDRMKINAADEIADGFWESSKKLFPFLHMSEMVYDKTAIKKKIMEDAGFKKILSDFTAKFDTLKTETDMTKVKASIDTYYATLKELRTTQNSIVDMTDKNGDLLTTAVTAFKSTFTGTAYCFSHGVKLIYEGKWVKGAAYLYGGCASVAVIGKLSGLSKASGIIGLGFRGTTAIAKAPFQMVNAVLPKKLLLSNVTNYIPSFIAKQRYTTSEKIIEGMGRGLSYEKAYNLYSAIGGGTEKTRSFFTDILNLKTRDASFISRMESIVFKNGKMTDVGQKFLNESFTKPGILSTKKTIEVTGNLDDLVSKYEATIQATTQSETALAKIAVIAKSTENLGDITTLAGNYTNLLTKADDVNSLTYKILQQWGTADGDAAKYLTDATQIGKAKAYAEKVIELNKGVEGTVETTKLGEAWKGAKAMFKEGMDKIKTLFGGNKTISAAQKTGLEDGITKATNETDAITGKTFENAAKNPAGEEAKTVANVMKGKIGLWTRILKWSPLLVDGIINIFNGVGLLNEAAEIEKTNVERASVREEKATFTLTLAGAEIAMFAVGVAMSWNPAGWVILAVTASIEALKFGVNKYYEVVETYYRNFEDFRNMYMAHIKQEIISKEAWGDGIDISLKESFQGAVSAVFGSACHGDKKEILSLKTREDALRALIWMEECENYPYATLNLESFKGTEYTELQTEVNTQSDAMKADSVTRFNYIKEKYGDKFISAQKIESAEAQEDIDKVLLESRQYLTMTKDTKTKAKDIVTYQAEKLTTLKENEGFVKLEALYVASPLQFHKMMKSLPYYSFMFQQFDKTTYTDYDKIATNMEYIVQYYNYKTFGLLPSDIPDITIEADKVDYTMMETFFKEFTIKPTGFSKEDLESAFTNNQIDIMTPDMIEREENVSPNLGQNILYRIAKEVLGGYTGKNNLDDLKLFYTPEQRTRTGIYYEDGGRYLNNSFTNMNFLAGGDQYICSDAELNDIDKVGVLSSTLKLAAGTDSGNRFTSTNKDNARYTLIETDTGTGSTKLSKEYGVLIGTIIAEEIAYRTPENIAKYKSEAEVYIKANSDGKYIPLTSDMINNLTKAGVANTGYYYYKRDGTKLTALEAIVGVVPAFLVNKTCGLTANIETYKVKEVAYSTEIKDKISVVDGLISKLSSTILLDGEDLDVQADIKKMIIAKGVKWAELKVQLGHMDQIKAKELLDTQYDEFETFFDNIYMMILHCASSGSSNDVDTYDDYLSISRAATGSLLDFKTDTGTMQASVTIPEFDYMDEFNATILKYTIPEKNKTIPDLLNSKEASDVSLGKKYAYVVLRSILESAMIKYDVAGTTQTGVCNAGAQSIDDVLLAKRLAVNVKTVKEDVIVKKDATTTK